MDQQSKSKEVCFCSEEYLIHKNQHNPSYSLPSENFRKYIVEHGEPLTKRLTNSDINVNLNRFLLNKNQAEEYFLPLLDDHENIDKGVDVCGYDDYENVYFLTFKKWANKYYVLNGDWKFFFQNHQLQSNDTITSWMFRHSNHTKLCIALEYEKIGR